MKKHTFEPEVQEYLKLKSNATRRIYGITLRNFGDYYTKKYGVSNVFSHFLDRIFDEKKKPPREQKRLIETELAEYINVEKAKGKSNNTIRAYITTVQNFLKYKNITVSARFIGNMPPATTKKSNGKHEWYLKQIRQFVEVTPDYRDKAIILCMFQSGLAVNEICNLDYGDIQEEFEEGILPICIKLVRQKTSVEFKTFLGRDAVKYLRLYLATRKDLKPDSPLFTKLRQRGGEARIMSDLVRDRFNEISQDLPFIKQKGGYNPARPHSLRSAFNSQLVGKIDETLREFWMGHSIGGVARAYLNMPTDELRKLYMTAEEYLKIEKTSREEIDQTTHTKVPPEVAEKIKLFSSDVDRFRDELAQSKVEVKDLKEQLKSAIEMVYSFEPILNTFSEIANSLEGQELINKIHEAKEKQEMKDAQEEDNKLRAEITAENPAPKKVKGE
ncbi:tyrosine-type recombinase/integrase [Thermoproteota archaeon]